MSRTSSALVACFALAACTGGVSPTATSSASRAILGGEIATGDPLVGMLEFSTGRFGTASLIAPNLVLTAAHVVGGNIQAFYTGQGVASVPLDNTTASPTMKRHEIGRKEVHPSYGCRDKGDCDAWDGVDLDIGVVELATPITDQAPYPLDATVPAVGDRCRTVGFGFHTEEGVSDYDMGTVKLKRQADVDVIDVDPTYVLVRWVTGIADHGDSGGPLFCAGKLVATTTLRTDGELAAHREEYDTRVDRALPWIQQKMLEWGPPVDMAVTPDLATMETGGRGGCAVGSEGGPIGWWVFAAVLLLRRRQPSAGRDRAVRVK